MSCPIRSFCKKGVRKLVMLLYPDDQIGFGTVCSVTINGIFLKTRISRSHPRFGGVLQIEDLNHSVYRTYKL